MRIHGIVAVLEILRKFPEGCTSLGRPRLRGHQRDGSRNLKLHWWARGLCGQETLSLLPPGRTIPVTGVSNGMAGGADITKAWRPPPQCRQWSIHCFGNANTCGNRNGSDNSSFSNTPGAKVPVLFPDDNLGRRAVTVTSSHRMALLGKPGQTLLRSFLLLFFSSSM